MENLIKISHALILNSKIGFMGDIFTQTMKSVNAARAKGVTSTANTVMTALPKARPVLGTRGVANPVDKLSSGGVSASASRTPGGMNNPIDQLPPGGINAY